jgi:hypothetical protein
MRAIGNGSHLALEIGQRFTGGARGGKAIVERAWNSKPPPSCAYSGAATV